MRLLVVVALLAVPASLAHAQTRENANEQAEFEYASGALIVGIAGGWEATVLTQHNAIVPGGPQLGIEAGGLWRWDRLNRIGFTVLGAFAPNSDATAWDLGAHVGLRLGIRSDFLSGVVEVDGGYRREDFSSVLLPDRDAIRTRVGLGIAAHGAVLPTVELGITPLALQLEHIVGPDLTILSWAPRVWLSMWL